MIVIALLGVFSVHNGKAGSHALNRAVVDTTACGLLPLKRVGFDAGI